MGWIRNFWRATTDFLSIFPEREFHYRSRGKVQYFSVSSGAQLGLAVLVIVGVAWSVFATFYFVTFDRVLREKNFEVVQARKAQKQLLAEVNRFNQRLRLVASNIQRSRKDLLALGRRVTGKDGGTGSNRMTEEERRRFEKSQQALQAQIRILGGAYKELNKRSASLESGLRSFGQDVETVMARHAKVKLERDRLRRRVLVLRKEMSDMVVAQRRVVQRLESQANRSVEQAERVIAMTGLKPDRVIALINPDGVGGPDVGAGYTTASTGSEDSGLQDQVARLTLKVRRLELLRRAVRNLPLIAPLDSYRQTSGYGRRRDPFRGTWSTHNGLDFVNKSGTPVLSTAQGRVVYAGWRGGYGWFVEIDHGMGVRTRYAHLQKIMVGKGQRVNFRDKVGLLGTSGRSTGPHLHYEVVINGKAVNPINFITAGKYVFKD